MYPAWSSGVMVKSGGSVPAMVNEERVVTEEWINCGSGGEEDEKEKGGGM